MKSNITQADRQFEKVISTYANTDVQHGERVKGYGITVEPTKIMKQRVFAIGDVHGHYDELRALLTLLETKAGFNLNNDHLVLLGDLVDNGGQTKKTIDFCIETQKEFPDTFHVIKGNHEDLLLDALDKNHPKYGDYYLWWNQGGQATLKSYTPDNLSDYEKAITQPSDLIGKEHLNFFRSLPLYWETEDYFFVHGGVVPGLPLVAHYQYDPLIQDKMLWIRDEFINSNYDWGKIIVYGHTAKDVSGGQYSKFEPYVMKNKIGINTMPRNLGHLTAVELPSEKFWVV